jgi:hypothetical protein
MMVSGINSFLQHLSIVVSHKNVTKVVWSFLGQLSSSSVKITSTNRQTTNNIQIQIFNDSNMFGT